MPKMITTKPVQQRNCAVCGSSNKKALYQQRFSGMSGQSLLDGYTITVCLDCGFGFADSLPDQQAFDAYYRDMSKYEQQHSTGGGEADHLRCQGTADTLDRFLSNRAARILDIGCATGHVLGLLKQKGYTDVLGVDPSAECARLARQLYDVEVQNFTISTLPQWETRFDAVLLISVIEHVQTLHTLLDRVAALVKEGGLLYLEHPDVTRFSPAAGGPFQEFSTEHVNFFSRQSLSNLVRQHHFVELHSFQEDRQAAQGVMVPSSSSIFRKEQLTSTVIVRDDSTEQCLSTYIRRSSEMEEGVRWKILDLIENHTRFVVWGVGTHTQHLMETTPLQTANIVAFVDSNPRYHGKSFNGIPILPPEALRGITVPVLVSSMIFYEEILSQMRNDLNIDNQVIRLY